MDVSVHTGVHIETCMYTNTQSYCILLFPYTHMHSYTLTHMLTDSIASLATPQDIHGLLSKTSACSKHRLWPMEEGSWVYPKPWSPSASLGLWFLDEEAPASHFPQVSQWLSSDCGWVLESKRVLIPAGAEMQLTGYSDQLIIEAKSLFWYF